MSQVNLFLDELEALVYDRKHMKSRTEGFKRKYEHFIRMGYIVRGLSEKVVSKPATLDIDHKYYLDAFPYVLAADFMKWVEEHFEDVTFFTEFDVTITAIRYILNSINSMMFDQIKIECSIITVCETIDTIQECKNSLTKILKNIFCEINTDKLAG